MSLNPGTRTKRRTHRRPPRIGLLAIVGLLVCAEGAQAWSQPQPLYTGAARNVFSVAGDNAGNAFAVLAGESGDLPLILAQRSASGEDPFIWSTLPFPGGERIFTTPGHGLDSFA